MLANGGGSTVLEENSRRAKGSNQALPGMDFNGDGDTLDAIRFYTPNNTNTHRIGLTSSLIWDISPDHRVRVAYTLDRAHHRQTGEWGFLESGGDPESPFSGRNATPVLNATGFQIQQRNRQLDRPSEPDRRPVDRQVLRPEAAGRSRRPPSVLQARPQHGLPDPNQWLCLLHRRTDPSSRHAAGEPAGGYADLLDPDLRRPGRCDPVDVLDVRRAVLQLRVPGIQGALQVR